MRDKDSKILEEKYLSIFEAVVPVSKMRDVRKGLRKKYGRSEYIKRFTKNTFGFDIEFQSESSDYTPDRSRVNSVLSDIFLHRRDRRVLSDLYNIVDDFMSNIYEDYYRQETEGYTSIDDWDYDNPEPEEPEREDGQTDDEYEEMKNDWEAEYQDWKERRNEIEDNLTNAPSFEDNWNEFVDYFIENEYYQNSEFIDYFNEELSGIADDIEIAREIIETSLHEYDGETFSIDDWDVSEDATDVLEVTSPICTTKDIPILKEILEKIYDKFSGGAAGNTSAHIHIGLPEDFDVFDVIALYDLIDEKTIKELDRDEHFTKGKEVFFEKLEKILLENDRNDNILEFSRFLSFIDKDRYMGINLRNVIDASISDKKYKKKEKDSHKYGKSIEFRYPSSRILNNIDYFFNLIQYFMHIVEIAKSRNRIIIQPNNIELVRLGADSLKFKIGDGKKIKQIGYPSNVLRQQNYLVKTKLRREDVYYDENLMNKFLSEKRPAYVDIYIKKNNKRIGTIRSDKPIENQIQAFIDYYNKDL